MVNVVVGVLRGRPSPARLKWNEIGDISATIQGETLGAAFVL